MHKKQKPTAMYKHLSCPQMPEQPLRKQVAFVGGHINTSNKFLCITFALSLRHQAQH